MKVTDKIEITCEDNMELMARYSDNYFELAIVDPPYNLKKSSLNGSGKLKNRAINILNTDWDIAPSKKYFKELFRISKNQIIWGGNYFLNNLNNSRCIICWDKKQPFPNFSAWELAWTSFDKPAKLFSYDNRKNKKIHPTQKPIKLYEWLLINFAKEGDKILDTHLGSGSLAIACHNLKYNLIACELDKDYYNSSIKRIKNHIAQQRLF
jgi:site-specific DNA-methyltransferase (adenine-specific)